MATASMHRHAEFVTLLCALTSRLNVGSPIHASFGLRHVAQQILQFRRDTLERLALPISSFAVKDKTSGRVGAATDRGRATSAHCARNPFMSAVPRP